MIAVLLVALVVGCSAPGGPAAPGELSDPCPLITDEMLRRLALGSERVPSQVLGAISGDRSCAVDLAGAMRGDLYVEVAVTGTGSYDEKWRSERCAGIQAEPTADGPGDRSCFRVKAWADGEARIDGWAWSGDDFEVRVAYQLVDPQILPPGAEQDLRDLLASAVDTLPV